MLVLSVKKIKFALLGTFAMFMLIAIAISLKDDKLEYVDTVSLPVSGKIVVVDAGHGVPDERSCLLTLKITLIFYKK